MMLLQAVLLLAALAQGGYDRNKNVFVEIAGQAFYTQEAGPDLAHEIPKGCGRCAITIKRDAADYVVNFKRWSGQWRWTVYEWKTGRAAAAGQGNPFMVGSDCGRAIQGLINKRRKR